ncbi:MAG: hypothetical protein U5Q44_13175 [Dehalococcoidia bacterium]|nr:hypothetical protein [Dehalococcoidia bacterium]
MAASTSSISGLRLGDGRDVLVVADEGFEVAGIAKLAGLHVPESEGEIVAGVGTDLELGAHRAGGGDNGLTVERGTDIRRGVVTNEGKANPKPSEIECRLAVERHAADVHGVAVAGTIIEGQVATGI